MTGSVIQQSLGSTSNIEKCRQLAQEAGFGYPRDEVEYVLTCPVKS